MNKKRKALTVIVFTLFAVMIAAGGYILFGGQVKPSIDATYNATVNFDLIYNENDECYKSENENDTIVFVLSNSCAPCVKQLEIIKYVDYIADSVNLMILWEDEIPKSRIENLGVSDNIKNYTLKGKSVINTGLTPQSFVMDSQGKVIFSNEDSDIGKMINVIYNNYKKSDSLEELIGSFENDRIVFNFCSDGDSDSEIVNKYKEKGYAVISVTSYNQGSQNNVIYDEGNLFRKLFDLGSSKTLVVCEYGKPVSYINY
ncbi:MAG: hypothetical protein HFE79_14090 [Ruminiclostridium sp.]|nr:hypothetical protein [Ruminiclostridium sp.]